MSAAQRAVAEKPLRAIEKLLPQGLPAIKEAYSRGFTDGAAHERWKSRTNQPEKNV